MDNDRPAESGFAGSGLSALWVVGGLALLLIAGVMLYRYVPTGTGYGPSRDTAWQTEEACESTVGPDKSRIRDCEQELTRLAEEREHARTLEAAQLRERSDIQAQWDQGGWNAVDEHDARCQERYPVADSHDTRLLLECLGRATPPYDY